MTLTFQNHGDRLLRENVAPQCFGGFTASDRAAGTETLYAINPGDRAEVYARTQAINAPSFDGPGWARVDAVPPDAEWIGSYRVTVPRRD